MDDLEITKRCAEAMGYKGWRSKYGYWNMTDPDGVDHVCCNGWLPYDAHSGKKLPEPTLNDALAELGFDPIHDDAQAMALVKKFQLELLPRFSETDDWLIEHPFTSLQADNVNLNRAICECVANLRKP